MQTHGTLRLAQDPILTPVGETCKVGIVGVWNERRKSFDKETGKYVEKDQAHFVPCEAWDTAAEYIHRNAEKGDKIIIIDGLLKYESWGSGENKRSKNVVRIIKFELKKKRTAQPEDSEQSEPQEALA